MMPKILILCADSSSEWSEAFSLEAMKFMPPGFAGENMRFQRARDRRNRILARLLVLRGLVALCALPEEKNKQLPTKRKALVGASACWGWLSSWCVDSLGRPFLAKCAQPSERVCRGEIHPRRGMLVIPDFNISHTDGAVAAAVSISGRVGVDVERRIGGEVEEYLTAFTENERSWILADEPAKDRMLRLWTRKEAILKAAGTGFSLAPSEFDTLNEETVVRGVRYCAREIPIDLGGGFFCHIASGNVSAPQKTGTQGNNQANAPAVSFFPGDSRLVSSDSNFDEIELRCLTAEETLGELEELPRAERDRYGLL